MECVQPEWRRVPCGPEYARIPGYTAISALHCGEQDVSQYSLTRSGCIAREYRQHPEGYRAYEDSVTQPGVVASKL